MITNKKFILLKECLLKYWEISNNIILFRTIYNNRYPVGIYFIAYISLIFSFTKLMLNFRYLNIPSISYILYPMEPCEKCMCIKQEDGHYKPSCKRFLLGGFILFSLWLWYAFFIYPFLTFFVIISVFYYHIDDDEFKNLLILYKNHNISVLFISDIPIIILLSIIYSISKKGLFGIIWTCLLTIIKIINITYRYKKYNKIYYDIDDINYEFYNSENQDREMDEIMNISFQSIDRPDDDISDYNSDFWEKIDYLSDNKDIL